MVHDEAYQEAKRRIEKARRYGAKELDLAVLGLTTLPESLGGLTQLRMLYLDNNRLRALPESLGQLTQLQTLFLNNNQLTVLSELLGQLTQLQTLYLSGNRLTALPESLSQLAQLQTLYLGRNRLTTLPKSLGQLARLQTVSLPSNGLRVLPESLGQLAQLHTLYLDNNRLTGLPETLGQLTQLRELYLGGNRLTALPESIGQLAQLQTVYLSSNRLTALPESLQRLAALTELYLHRNPALGLPPEVLGPTWDRVRGGNAQPARPQAILDYYFRIHPPMCGVVVAGTVSVRQRKVATEAAAARPLNEAKLILVGPGEAGKTSLVNRLVKDRFNPKESTTHGIRITQWKLAVGRDEVRLNLWDFGGQDIQHATHQFFLTERSLYVVVLDGRKGAEDDDAEYWLKFIKAFGGNSPAIVVLNKQRLHPYDVNRTSLREKYPFIREFIATDCRPETRNGIPQLRKEIQAALAEMPEVRMPFPAEWFRIKERLAGMKKPFMPFEEFRDVCEELNESNKEAQERLAYYLNCLGIALNFREDSRLRDTSVLKPQWITRGIYRIITSRRLQNEQGELQESDLSSILPAKDYPEEKHAFLLDLMRKFELCFEFHDGGTGRRFLVPELLGKQKPDLKGEFAPEHCLSFRYAYRLLPEGLLPRFIVRTYPMSEGKGKNRWRTGVVLSWGDCRALVEVDKSEQQVFIRVNGDPDRRKRLLAVIRANFEHIHYEMKGEFKPTEWIALEDHPGEWVDYQDLEVHARERKDTYRKRVGNELVTLDPAQMLSQADIAKPERFPSEEARFEADRRRPVKLFVSYSHKDDKWRDTLKSNLDILAREGLVEAWHDQRIAPGSEFDDAIKAKLAEAEIVLFLLSADLLASKYVREVELPMAWEQRERGQTQVLPVVVRTCSWKRTPLGRLEALPDGGKPLRKHPDRDQACLEIEEAIRAAAEAIRNRKRGA